MASRAASGGFKKIWATWYETAALPIYAVVVGASAGAAWYCTYLIRKPDVILDRKSHAANQLKPLQFDEQGKFIIPPKFQ